MGRPGQAWELAPAHLCLDCEDSSYVTGQVFHVAGGMSVGRVRWREMNMAGGEMAAQGPLAAILAGLLALPASCDLPRDPAQTRDRVAAEGGLAACLLYTSPSPRDS